MNVDNVEKLLEENKDERGIKAWEKSGAKGIKSYGLGMTKLKALSKKIKPNHELARELWNSSVFDMYILSTLIDEPQKVTFEQVEEDTLSIEQKNWGLSHAYYSYLVSRTKLNQQIVEQWHKSDNDQKRRGAYLALYNLAKGNKELTDDYFEGFIDRIEKELQGEENFVRDAMNNALWAMGMRSKVLNKRALEAAKKIGVVMVDYGDNSCEAINVTKHLSNPKLQERLAKA